MISGPAVYAEADRAIVPFAALPAREVSPEVMQRIFGEVQTPHKYGVVLRGGPDELIDCPSVFRHEGRWYMMYIGIKDKVGYETHIARSDDLLHWEKLGKILTFRHEGWDAWQADGGIALYDYEWNGTHTLGQHEGKYWMTYIGGALKGYEPDPLAIGIASTSNPMEISEWTRQPENPVLAPSQPDARAFEKTTLYKSTVIHDRSETLGWPFVMFYNGKAPVTGHEAIGMAVSRDFRTWHRYGSAPVLSNIGESRWAISGDPQLTKIGDVWVMFYFGAFWQPNAFDTFACSYDLVHWTKWNGPHLIEPSVPYDEKFAHKPWVLKHEGVVYHFYCAVGTEGRVIALATSNDLRTAQ
ncbi:MAG: glycosylase [Opitutus sp.]